MITDLYPETDEEVAELRTWCLDAWIAATSARNEHESRWDRYDKHYETYVKRDKSDWRSRVIMPEIFTQIETIKPRLISHLPKFLPRPVGPEDVELAQLMETLMDWAARNSKLHLELVKLFHPVLLYGTGILKTFPETRYGWGSEMSTVFQTETQLVKTPIIDPDTQRPMIDPDGNPVLNEEEISLDIPVDMVPEKIRYVAYDGPGAKSLNIRNFWPAPEAEDVQGARYCIHRVYKSVSEIQRLILKGVYRFPEEMSFSDLFTAHDDPRITQMESLEFSPGNDPTRKQLELLEFWTNDGPDSPGRVITIANRKAILRVHENPFWHGMKPFVRFVDYLRPNHFWGIGEVQAMEGLQDAINAIVNQRIDAGRLINNPMFAVNKDDLYNLGDLAVRPGGVVPFKGDGSRANEVLHRIDLGEVPTSAFTEVQSLQNMSERVTAVSSYQQGIDAPSQVETATGAAIMQEAGASRFGLKVKLFEIDPFEDLSLQYGSLLQQFTSTERVVRLVGPAGEVSWQKIDPAALQGRLDYTVETTAAQQSETVKRQQALDIFSQVAQAVQMQVLPPDMATVAFKQLLEAMDAKAIIKALEDRQLQLPQQQLPEQPQAPQIPQAPPQAQMPSG